jgi:hypothetical protein
MESQPQLSPVSPSPAPENDHFEKASSTPSERAIQFSNEITAIREGTKRQSGSLRPLLYEAAFPPEIQQALSKLKEAACSDQNFVKFGRLYLDTCEEMPNFMRVLIECLHGKIVKFKKNRLSEERAYLVECAIEDLDAIFPIVKAREELVKEKEVTYGPVDKIPLAYVIIGLNLAKTTEQ